jgi:hypothetical protein
MKLGALDDGKKNQRSSNFRKFEYLFSSSLSLVLRLKPTKREVCNFISESNET